MSTTLLTNRQSTYGSPYVRYGLKATEVSRTSTSVKIKLEWTAHLETSSSTLGAGYSLIGKVKIAGSYRNVTIKSSSESWSGTTEHKASGTFTISASSGLKSLTNISVKVDRGDSSGNSGKLTERTVSNIQISAGITPTKPETDVLYAFFGDTITISHTNSFPNCSFELGYKFGNITGQITSGQVTTQETNFTIPYEIASQIPSSLSGTLKIICSTYNSGSLVGTDSCDVTVTVTESMQPEISNILVSDGRGYEDVVSAFLVGLSTYNIEFSVNGKYGTTIVDRTITANGETFSSQSAETGVILNDAQTSILIVATDSRGLSATREITIDNLTNYSKPSILSVSEPIRCTQQGVPDEDGDYIKTNVSFSYTQVGSNICRASITASQISGSGEVSAVVESGVDTILNATHEKSWYIDYEIVDAVGESDFLRKQVTTGNCTYSAKRGYSFAIGKVAELGTAEEPIFESNWNTILKEMSLPIDASAQIGYDSNIKTRLEELTWDSDVLSGEGNTLYMSFRPLISNMLTKLREGGGGGGSTDYNDLFNKPSINGNQLSGNKTSVQLGLANAVHSHSVSQIDDFPTTLSYFTNDSGYLTEHQSLAEYRKASAQDIIDATKYDASNPDGFITADDLPDMSNYVDLASNQTITGNKTIKGSLNFEDGNIYLGSISAHDYIQCIGDFTFSKNVQIPNVAITSLNDNNAVPKKVLVDACANAVTDANAYSDNIGVQANQYTDSKISGTLGLTLISEEIELFPSTQINANAYKTGTVTITKAGYTPLAIVGWRCSWQYWNWFRLILENVSAGTGTINYGIFNNNSSNRTSSASVTVLWIKS